MVYYDVLNVLHHLLAPQAYLEIGVWKGASLALSSSRTIGVDPEPMLEQDVAGTKPWLKLYRMTSDAFFHECRRDEVLEGADLELVFIDGMHHFENVLRDVANAERWSSPHGLIAVHDVLPGAVDWALREPVNLSWTGDVWRIVPCLRRYRPDLRLTVLDAPGSGLLLIGNLDPASTVLRERYAEIVAEFLGDPRPYDEQVLSYLATVGRVDCDAWLRDVRRTMVF